MRKQKGQQKCRHPGKRYAAAGILTAAAIFSVVPKMLRAGFYEGSGVHIRPDEVENATLAVGTHLISLESLNDHIYELAVQSAEESGQLDIYYKSELADGAWYEISSAVSLQDITGEEGRVDSQVIAGLFFTYHTSLDGNTYDLRTYEEVNIFDIQDPYNLLKLKELQSLANQKKALEKSGVNTQLLDEFFEEDIENEKTNELDGQIARLYEYRRRLSAGGGSKEAMDTIGRIMEKADAGRRYEADCIAIEKLNELMDQVSSDKEFSANSDLTAALGNSLKELQGSVDALDAERILTEDGAAQDLALAQTERELADELIEAVETGDDTAAQALNNELASLYRLAEGKDRHSEDVKAVLDNRLLPRARQLAEESGSQAAQNELDYFEAIRRQMDGETEENKELSGLYDEKEKLSAQKLKALDEKDPEEAKKIEALETQVQSQIQKLEAAGEYADGSASQGIQDRKTEVLHILENLQQEGENAADVETAKTALEGIGALCQGSPQAAAEALEEIYQKLAALWAMDGDSQPIYEELLNQTEGLLSSSLPAVLREIHADTIAETVEEIDGVSLERGDARKNGAALAGIGMFCQQTETDSESPAALLLEAKAKSFAGEEESFVFSLPGTHLGSNYAPADKLAYFCSMRYVWRENQKQAVLAGEEEYYQFTAFSDTAMVGQEEKKLEEPVLFQAVLYIPSAFVEEQFSCQVYPLPGTTYCVLLDDDMAELASAVCDRLLAL